MTEMSHITRQCPAVWYTWPRSGRWTYQLAPNLSARTWERSKPASPSTQARERNPPSKGEMGCKNQRTLPVWEKSGSWEALRPMAHTQPELYTSARICCTSIPSWINPGFSWFRDHPMRAARFLVNRHRTSSAGEMLQLLNRLAPRAET